MRIHEILSEKWDRRVGTNYSRDKYDVFINPSKSEILLEICKGRKSFRWIADVINKTFYAFTSDLLHKFVLSELGEGKYIYGLAVVIQGQPIQYLTRFSEYVASSYCFHEDVNKEIHKNPWINNFLEFRDEDASE
jgi:hypothetical protein